MEKKSILFFLFFINALLYGQNFNYIPSTTTSQIIEHTYYTLSYSAKDKQAEWVAYVLTKENLMNGNAERTNNFMPDPLITEYSATLADYYKSGYDRGHLAPAADMKINTTAISECFYLSNISPQKAEFNRGIWEKLEEQVREWAKEYDTLYIVTGGILKYSIGTIGAGKVSVPKYFYKVILNKTNKNYKAIALILPNEKGTKQLYEYVVPIDSVEILTGIDFFPALPYDLANKLESKVDIGSWKFDVTIDANKNAPPTQCKGVTVDGDRCKKYTPNANGYCDNHQSQVGKVDMSVTKENRRTIAIRCSAITKKSTQCKRLTFSPNGKCWQHGGN
jgi:endonuclease G